MQAVTANGGELFYTQHCRACASTQSGRRNSARSISRVRSDAALDFDVDADLTSPTAV
jgi:hypothetical protein